MTVLFHFQYMNDIPSYTHAWAQADYYAMSLRFLDNGFNFFKPETYVMNHQFPTNFNHPNTTSITAVDFPIHAYTVAWLMKIFSTDAPWVFRLYTLLYSGLGIFFMFKISQKLLQNSWKSMFVILFMITSPVFVYYQASFLPGIPSLANAIIGLYFYLNYLLEGKKKHFGISIFFLTLSILSRTTFLIVLCSVLLVEGVRFLKKENTILNKILPVILSFGSILGYLKYNSFLRENYSSMFLSKLQPAQSMEDVIIVFKAVLYWAKHYFSIYHYLIFLVIIALFFFGGKILNLREKMTDHISKTRLLVTTIFVGYFAFFIAMMRQFKDHDYYFLDTFFLPALLLIIILISVILVNKYVKGVALLFILLFTFTAFKSQKSRHQLNPNDDVTKLGKSLQNSDAFLLSLGVKRDATILMLGSHSPNLPFAMMRRKGYAIMYPSAFNIEKTLKWDYDYVIVEKEFFTSHLYKEYPKILEELDKIGSKDNIIVCTHAKTKNKQTLNQFLGFSQEYLLLERALNFEDTLYVQNPAWRGIVLTKEKFKSGKQSCLVPKGVEYGLTYSTQDFPLLTQKNTTLIFSADFLKEGDFDGCKLIFALQQDGQHLLFKKYDLVDLLKKDNTWETLDLRLYLPKITSDDYDFGVFIWSNAKHPLYIDDFSMKFY